MARCTAWARRMTPYKSGRCMFGLPLYPVKNGKRVEHVCRTHRAEFNKYGCEMFKRRPKDWREYDDGNRSICGEISLPGSRRYGSW